jgi:TolB protein
VSPRSSLPCAALLVCAAFAVATLAFAAPAQSPPARVVWDFQDLSWSPDGKTITFTGITGKDYRIYRIAAAPGAAPAALFENMAGLQLAPTWSPDGKSIAFHFSQAGQGSLYVANSDGSGARKIAEGGVAPSWSPNGRSIAYCAKVDGKYQVHVVDPDGRDVKQVTRGEVGAANPSWSPDSKLIVFESDRDHDDQDELYRIGADGTNETLLRRQGDANLVYPDYSPDGRVIFYGAVANRQVDLYLMDADGANPRLLHRHASHATWSKAAGRIAYIAYDENKVREIFIARPDGSGEVAITSLNH